MAMALLLLFRLLLAPTVHLVPESASIASHRPLITFLITIFPVSFVRSAINDIIRTHYRNLFIESFMPDHYDFIRINFGLELSWLPLSFNLQRIVKDDSTVHDLGINRWGLSLIRQLFPLGGAGRMHCQIFEAFMKITFTDLAILCRLGLMIILPAPRRCRQGGRIPDYPGDLQIDITAVHASTCSRAISGVLLPVLTSPLSIWFCATLVVWHLMFQLYICVLMLSSSHPSQAFRPKPYQLKTLMSDLSPTSPLSLNSSSHGDSSNLQDDVPLLNHSAQSPSTAVLVGSRSDHTSQPTQPLRPTFSDTLKYGLGSLGGGSQPSAESKLGFQSRPSESPGVILEKGEPSNTPQNPDPENSDTSSLEPFLSCCLFGKIWGDPVPLPAIIHRTRNSWKFTKGQIDYVELGNGWILLRFANCQDKMLVYEERPWFVNGLNFVLLPWRPFFDPFSTVINRVDQWVRIPRLPWELWNPNFLSTYLQHVGDLIKMDHNTLHRLKGKFARVCVNIDITKPLPGSLSIIHPTGCVRVPLIYEGLHEVCPLCGGESHLLETCPKLPTSTRIEVVVEKFETSTDLNATLHLTPQQNPTNLQDNWVTVSPKKRVKAMIQAKPRKNSLLNPEKDASIQYKATSSNPSNPLPPAPAPVGSDGIILTNPMVVNPIQPLFPADPPEALHEGGDDIQNMDMYLNLQQFEDVDMATDSAKRKRFEEDDGSSPRS